MWISCAMMAGVYFSEYAFFMMASALAVVGGLACIMVMKAIRFRVLWKLASIPVAFLIGISLWQVDSSRFMELDQYKGETVELSGTAYGLDLLGDSLRLTDATLKAKGEVFHLKKDIRLRFRNDQKVPEGMNGSSIVLRAVWDPAESAANPRGFDYQTYLQRSGFQSEIKMSPWQIVECMKDNWDARAMLYAFRAWYGTALLGCLPLEEGSVAYGMAIGDTVLIPEELINSYRVSGLGHLLSVSGLHFAILFDWLQRMLAKVPIGESRKTALIVGVLTFMGFLNGWTAPALRAWGMILLLIASKKCFRQYDGFTALSSIALVTTIMQPTAVLQPGFQFSYASVLGLITLTRPLEAYIPIRNRHIREYVAASVAVQAAVIPMGIFWFGFWNPLTLLLNFPVMVLSEWLMPALVLFPVTLLFGQMGNWIAGGIIGSLVWGMNACSNFMVPQTQDWLLASPTVGRLGGILLIIMVVSRLIIPVAGGVTQRTETNRILIFMAILLIGVHLNWVMQPRTTFFAVGQGDAAMIEFQNRRLLIDAGPATAKLDRLLLRNGIRKVDALVITHGHEDHIGGAVPILKHLRVGSIVIGTEEAENPLFVEMLEVARKRGVPVQIFKQGQTLYSDRDRILEVLYPFENKAQEDPNAHSLVLLYREGDFKTLFTGDLGKAGEEALMTRGLLPDVNLLKVPHHGSLTSNSQAWMEQIAPETAVISVGHNLYGLPNRAIIDAYRKYGTVLYRTDDDGAVRVTMDSGRPMLKTWR